MTTYQGQIFQIDAYSSGTAFAGTVSGGSVAISAQSSQQLQQAATEYDVNSAGDDYLTSELITWTAYSGITGGHPVYYVDSGLFSSGSVSVIGSKVKLSYTPLGSSAALSVVGTRIVFNPIEAHYFGRNYFGGRYFPIWYETTSVVATQHEGDSNLDSSTFVNVLAGSLTHHTTNILSTSLLASLASRIAKAVSQNITGHSSVTPVQEAIRRPTSNLTDISSIISTPNAAFINSVAVQALSTTAMTYLFIAGGETFVNSSTQISSTPQRTRHGEIDITSAHTNFYAFATKSTDVESDVSSTANLVSSGQLVKQGQPSTVTVSSSIQSSGNATVHSPASAAGTSSIATIGNRKAAGAAAISSLATISPLAYVVAGALIQINSTSALISLANKIRAANVTITDTSNVLSTGHALLRGLSDTIYAISSLTSLGTGYRPATANYIIASSSVASVASFIGKVYSQISATSDIALLADLYRRTSSSLQSSSATTVSGQARRLGLSGTVSSTSDLTVDALITGAYGVNPILGTATVSALGKFIGSSQPVITSTSALTSHGVGFRPAQSGLSVSSSITSNGLGYRPANSDTVYSNSSVLSLAVGYRPGDLEDILVSSHIASLANRITKTTIPISSISSAITQANKFRPGASTIDSSADLSVTASTSGSNITATIQSISLLVSLGLGHRPGSSTVLVSSNVASVISFIGKSNINVASFSALTSYAERLVFSDSLIQDNSIVTSLAAAYKPALFNTFLATSQITTFASALRRTGITGISVSSTVATSGVFIGKAHIQLSSTSDITLIAELYRRSQVFVSSSTTLTSSANALKRPASTVLPTSAMTALGRGFRPATSNAVIVSSNVSSVVKFIGKAQSQLAVTSSLILLPELYRRSPVSFDATSFLSSNGLGIFQGSSEVIIVGSDIIANATRTNPHGVETILSDSFLAAVDKFIGSGKANLVSASSIASVVRRYRPVSTQLNSFSSIISNGLGYKPASLYETQATSLLISLGKGYKPAGSFSLFPTSYVGIAEKFNATGRSVLSSSVSIGVAPKRYAPIYTSLVSFTELVSVAAGLKPNSTLILSDSILSALGKAKKPALFSPLLPTSIIATAPRLIARSKPSLASNSVLSTLGRRFRPGVSNSVSFTTLVSVAAAIKPVSVTIQDSSVISALGKARRKSTISALSNSTVSVASRIRASGKATLTSASTVAQVPSSRARTAATTLTSTSSLLSIAFGLKPVSVNDILINSTVSALGKGKRPGTILTSLPTSTVSVVPRIIASVKTHPITRSAVVASGERTAYISSSLASTTSATALALALKPGSTALQSHSVTTALALGKKPGQVAPFIASSTVAVAARLRLIGRATHASTSILSATAKRSRAVKASPTSISSLVSLGRGYRPATSNTIFASSALTVSQKYYARMFSTISSYTSVVTSVKRFQRTPVHPTSVSSLSALANQNARQYSNPYSISSLTTNSAATLRPSSNIASTSTGISRANRIARSSTSVTGFTDVHSIPIFGSAGSGASLFGSASSIVVNTKAHFLDQSAISVSSLTSFDGRIKRRAKAPMVSFTSVTSSTTATRRNPISLYPTSILFSSPQRTRPATSYVTSVSYLNVNPIGRYRSRVNLTSSSYIDTNARRIRYGQSGIIQATSAAISAAYSNFRPLSAIVVQSSIIAGATVTRKGVSDILSTVSVATAGRGIFRDRIAIAGASSAVDTAKGRFKDRPKVLSYSSVVPNTVSSFIDSASINSTTLFLNLRGNKTNAVSINIPVSSEILPRGSLIPGGVGVLLDAYSQITINGRGRFRQKVTVSTLAEMSVNATRKYNITLNINPTSNLLTIPTRQAAGKADLSSATVLEARQKAIRRSSISISEPSHVRVMFYKAFKPGQSGIASDTSLLASHKLTRQAVSRMLPASAVASAAGKITGSTTSALSRSRMSAVASTIAVSYTDVPGVSALTANARARYRPQAEMSSVTAVFSTAYKAKYAFSNIGTFSTLEQTSALIARAKAPIYSSSDITPNSHVEFTSASDIQAISNTRIRRILRVRQAAASIQANSDLEIIGRMEPPIDSASWLVGI